VIRREFPYIPHVRHNVVSRAFSGLLSLWLAICMVEPAQLHTCAMHGGLAIEQTASSREDVVHHMATHLSHDSHHQSTDSKSHQCSCLGDCSGGSATVGLPAVRISPLAALVQDQRAVGFAYESPVVVTPDFVLRFANGPPSFLYRA
jgi:hypothetical protein